MTGHNYIGAVMRRLGGPIDLPCAASLKRPLMELWRRAE